MEAVGDTALIVPAHNEADSIAATVSAGRLLPGVDVVIVVDDGSSDATATAAAQAGARVVRHRRGRGKGAALKTGAAAVRLLDRLADRPVPRHLLFLDADLGETAKEAAPLIEPVRSREAQMTIACFTNPVKLGGHGLVVRLSREGIERATGFAPTQPLNGQRCLTREAFQAALPLAYGFGVETGLTIDLLRKGFIVREVQVPLAHRATGTDWRAQLHRARQFRDVALALAVREPARLRDRRTRRGR